MSSMPSRRPTCDRWQKLSRRRNELPYAQILKTRSSRVLGVHYEWRNNALVTLHNFHEKPATVSLDLKGKAGERLINLYSTDHSQAGPDCIHKIVLEGY